MRKESLILEQKEFMNSSMNEYSEFAVQTDYCWQNRSGEMVKRKDQAFWSRSGKRSYDSTMVRWYDEKIFWYFFTFAL